MATLRIGTRGSQLALWQARTVAERMARVGGPPCELVVIRTSGDRLSEDDLSEAGGKRLFVREIEDALLDGRVDLAVHSAKDMPAALPAGLDIGGVLPREDPRDAVVLPRPGRLAERDAPISSANAARALAALIGEQARIGTSSVRRVAQLAAALPRAVFGPIRGNLDTRLRKLDAGQFDAIVLAAAGLKRLGLADRLSSLLPVPLCVPAPGQGIIAVQIRTDDGRVRGDVAAISDAASLQALVAERALIDALGGGCQLPIGALASPDGDDLVMDAVVASLDGSRLVRASGRDRAAAAAQLGARLAAQLVAAGAGSLIDAARAGL